ncbi:MAG TPA: hypothetical protein VIE87_10450 [Pseudolabrys sp.]
MWRRKRKTGGVMTAKRRFATIFLGVYFCAVGPVAADDIALSLVHRQGRIDILVSAVRSVNAYATQTFVITGTTQTKEYPLPHVDLCFTKEIQEQICRLTRRIVEQPMEIVVDCRAISKPVVREPLCTGPCFQLSANDIFEANALAQRLKTGSNRPCAPTS